MPLARKTMGGLLGVALAVSAPSWAFAEDLETDAEPSAETEVADPTFEEARLAFEEGLAALEATDHGRAIESFQKSLGLRFSLPASFNLGLAYRAAGQYRKAVATLEHFLEMAAEAGVTTRVDRAKTLIESTRADLAQVTVAARSVSGPVTVDGERIGDGPGEYAVVLDPGKHVFASKTREGRALERELIVAAGARASIELAPPEPPEAKLVVETPIGVDLAKSAEPTLTERWWFWAGLGVLAAGATIGAVALAGGAPEAQDYDQGSLGVVFSPLGGR